MARASSPAAAAEPAERERRATDEITSVFEAATAAFQRPTTPCRRAPPFSTTLVAADARRELRPAPLVPIAATALPTFAVDIESLSAPTPRHDEPLRDVTPEARSAVPSIRAPLKLKPVARRLGRLAMFVTVVIVVFGGAAVAAAVSQRAFFAANLVPRAAAVHRTTATALRLHLERVIPARRPPLLRRLPSPRPAQRLHPRRCRSPLRGLGTRHDLA